MPFFSLTFVLFSDDKFSKMLTNPLNILNLPENIELNYRVYCSRLSLTERKEAFSLIQLSYCISSFLWFYISVNSVQQRLTNGRYSYGRKLVGITVFK